MQAQARTHLYVCGRAGIANVSAPATRNVTHDFVREGTAIDGCARRRAGAAGAARAGP